MTCPDHGVPYPCPVPINGHYLVEDGGDGWYVVRPYDLGRCGPFTEEEADRQLPVLRELYGVPRYVGSASGFAIIADPQMPRDTFALRLADRPSQRVVPDNLPSENGRP